MIVRAVQMMSGNIETNPGPTTSQLTNSDVSVTSYNIRGLKDEGKMRHLLNYCHSGATSTKEDSFYMFQETYLDKPGKIP